LCASTVNSDFNLTEGIQAVIRREEFSTRRRTARSMDTQVKGFVGYDFMERLLG
jgi:hypothetical protein